MQKVGKTDRTICCLGERGEINAAAVSVLVNGNV